MTAQYKSLTVCLEEDIHDDDAELLISVILHLRGVVGVQGDVVEPNDWVNRQRIRLELRTKLLAALDA